MLPYIMIKTKLTIQKFTNKVLSLSRFSQSDLYIGTYGVEIDSIHDVCTTEVAIFTYINQYHCY